MKVIRFFDCHGRAPGADVSERRAGMHPRGDARPGRLQASSGEQYPFAAPQGHVPRPLLVGALSALVLLLPFAVPVVAQVAVPATAVSGPELPPPLARIYGGDVPRSSDDLHRMDTYQRDLVRRVVRSVVAIQVGPTQGSGVIVTPDGFVLTASHVAVRPGMRALVILADGRRVRGSTRGMNKNIDAGLIKIDTLPGSVGKDAWPFAPMGSDDALRPGMWCLAFGHAGGFQEDRLQAGVRIGRIISVHKRSIETDCKLVGGDSGGPLFDMQGRVIGINSRIGASLNKNVHVPVDTFRATWDRLVKGESWGSLANVLGQPRPVIGVIRVADSDSPKIETVVSDSPAARAGIKPGDIITRFDRQPITTFSQLARLVQQHEPGDKVAVELRRGGATMEVDLVLGVLKPGEGK